MTILGAPGSSADGHEEELERLWLSRQQRSWSSDCNGAIWSDRRQAKIAWILAILRPVHVRAGPTLGA